MDRRHQLGRLKITLLAPGCGAKARLRLLLIGP